VHQYPSRSRFIEHGEFRVEHGHLENLVAFLLSAEKPSFTERLESLAVISTIFFFSSINTMNSAPSKRPVHGICEFRSMPFA
jgi:hypothetical protein